jgi:hypothetical protein
MAQRLSPDWIQYETKHAMQAEVYRAPRGSLGPCEPFNILLDSQGFIGMSRRGTFQR